MTPEQRRTSGAMSTHVRKSLQELRYTTTNPNVVGNFQRDYNLVSKYAKQISGKLAVDNIAGKSTLSALEQARVFQKKMPKGWIYYVKKFGAMEGVLPKRRRRGRRRVRRARRRR